MIEPPIPLVWAKLKPPLLPTQTVVRWRLVDLLAASDAALTAIVAPAGYGKTTTAVQLVQSLGHPVAWLSLEPADANPARFWTYVAAAFSVAGVDGADATYGHLTSGGVDSAILTLRAAIESTERPVILVLDDMQAINSDEINTQLTDWLRHPVANLQIICTSRSDLALPVGRLRSQGLLSEARIDELAFTTDESADLLDQTFGLGGFTADQLRVLAARTEGWPVGVYLAGLTLRDEPDVDAQLERFAGDARHLSEYLAVEAMDGITADMRAFVLATSIVSVLSPDLCDAVTGQVGSLRQLRDLVANNVFISALDEAGTMFQYHPLFREHLQSALAEEHPELIAEFHQRASRWFESAGDIDGAIVHASAAGEIQRAELLMSQTSLRFASAGHFDTVIGWVNSLGDPGQLMTETALLMSWTMLNLRRYDDLDRWLDRAVASGESELEQRVVAVQIPTIRTHQARHRGDVGEMIRWSDQALSLADNYPTVQEVANLFLRSDSGKGAAYSAAGAAQFWAGELDRSLDSMIMGLTIARSAGMLIEVIFCYGYLAIIEAERGDPTAALAHADQTLGMIVPGEERHHQPTLAHLAKSIALLSLGRPGDAEDELALAREYAPVRSEPLHDVVIELQAARLKHRVGDTEGARSAIRAGKAIVAEMPGSYFDQRIRAVEAEIRFVARDVPDLPAGARELTDREQAVLQLLPHGLPRKDVAAQLHVSENTVKTHLTSIRHKLGVLGRESIVHRAIELGLLPNAPTK